MSRTPRGFTLVELLIAVTIIGILTAIVTPSLLRARMSTNEASAIASIRAINSGQATYAATAARGGYATSLQVLGTACPDAPYPFLSADIGAADPIDKSGYRLRIRAGQGGVAGPTDCNGRASQTAYYATAVPLTFNATGQRSFGTNHRGAIFSSATAVAPSEAQFVQANALQ